MSKHTHNNNNVKKPIALQQEQPDPWLEYVPEQENKSFKQLKAEFELRKAARQLAQKNTVFVHGNINYCTTYSTTVLQQNAQLIQTTKVNFAIAQVRGALRALLHSPMSLSCSLVVHPCFPLLFEQCPSLQAWENQVGQVVDTHKLPTQVQELAHQLKLALPVLASSFENERCLDEVWTQCCLQIMQHPLRADLLLNIQQVLFSSQVSSLYQSSVAKPLARLRAIDKTYFYLRSLPRRVYSWFVLRVVIKKFKVLTHHTKLNSNP